MTRHKFIQALLLLLVIPVGTFLFAANPFAAREATTYTDLQVNDDAYVADDLTVDGTIIGDVTGDIIGDVTGDVLGDVTGDVVGSISGGTLSGTSLTVDESNGDAITGIYTGQGAVDSGSSSATVTVTGAASGDIAMANSITTGIGAYIAAAVAGTDQVVVTLSGNASTTSTIDVVVFGR